MVDKLCRFSWPKRNCTGLTYNNFFIIKPNHTITIIVSKKQPRTSPKATMFMYLNKNMVVGIIWNIIIELYYIEVELVNQLDMTIL